MRIAWPFLLAGLAGCAGGEPRRRGRIIREPGAERRGHRRPTGCAGRSSRPRRKRKRTVELSDASEVKSDRAGSVRSAGWTWSRRRRSTTTDESPPSQDGPAGARCGPHRLRRSEDAGFEDVRAAVGERSSARIHWFRGGRGRRGPPPARDLFARELTPNRPCRSRFSTTPRSRPPTRTSASRRRTWCRPEF